MKQFEKVDFKCGLDHVNPSVANYAHFVGRTSSSASHAFRDADYAIAVERHDAPNSSKWGICVAILAIAILFYVGHANAQALSGSTVTATTSVNVANGKTVINSSGVISNVVGVNPTATSPSGTTIINASGVKTNGVTADSAIVTGSFQANTSGVTTIINNSGVVVGGTTTVNGSGITAQNGTFSGTVNLNGAVKVNGTTVDLTAINSANANSSNALTQATQANSWSQQNAVNITALQDSHANLQSTVANNAANASQATSQVQANVDTLTTTVANNAQAATNATAQVQSNLNSTATSLQGQISANAVASQNATSAVQANVNTLNSTVQANQVATQTAIANTNATVATVQSNVAQNTADIATTNANLAQTNQVVTNQGVAIGNLQTQTTAIAGKIAGVTSSVDANGNTTTGIGNVGAQLKVGNNAVIIQSADFKDASGKPTGVDRITSDGSASYTLKTVDQVTGEVKTVVYDNALVIGGVAAGQNGGAKAVVIDSDSKLIANEAVIENLKATNLNGRNVDQWFEQTQAHEKRITGLENRIGNLENKVENYRQQSLQGISSANALALLQTPSNGKNFNVSVAVGGYQGAKALAIGATAALSRNSALRVGFTSYGGYGASLGYSF